MYRRVAGCIVKLLDTSSGWRTMLGVDAEAVEDFVVSSLINRDKTWPAHALKRSRITYHGHLIALILLPKVLP